MEKSVDWLETKQRATKEEIYGDCDDACSVNPMYYFTDDTAIEIQKDKIIYYKLINPFSIRVPYKKWNMLIHRNDGPAKEYINGDKSWYQNNKLHREDGPARIKDQTESWYENDKLHRDGDKPAVIIHYDTPTRPKGKEWWVKGVPYRESGPAKEYVNGGYEYYKDGKLHREDGPARYINKDEESWYINGKFHRTDGPACIAPNTKRYYIMGKRHRIDGPAVIYGDGDKFWYVNDIKIKFGWLKYKLGLLPKK